MTYPDAVNRRGRFVRFVILIFGMLLPVGAAADEHHPSPDLPPHSWVYDALDRFASFDSTDGFSLDTRPLTRAAAARIVSQLLEHEAIFPLGLRNTLESLRREFAHDPDIPSDTPALSFGPARLRPTFAAARFTLIGATRPQRPNVDPYERYPFGKGSNVGLQLDLGFTVNDRLLLFVSPHLLSKPGGTHARMERWTIRTRLLGFDAEIGRSSVSWGSGYRGNFVLSDNAPPTPMFRISRQGTTVNGAFLISRDSDHDPAVHPGTMIAYHIDWTIRRRLTLGFSGVSIVSEFSPSEFIAPNLTNPEDNRVFELSGALYVTPSIKIYGVTAGDDFFRENFPKRIIPWGRRSAYMAGVYLSDLLQDGATDLRVEVARLKENLLGEDWYRHTRYDYIRRGWIMGHPMARFGRTNETRTRELDVFVRLTRQWSNRLRTGITYDRQTADVRVPLPISGIPNPFLDLDDAVSFLGLEVLYHLRTRWTLEASGTWFGTLQLVKLNGDTWTTTQDRILRFQVGYRLF